MLLESARGPIPNVAELVAGEPIKGSWWGHRDGHAIFAVINELADSPDVVRLRLVGNKITLVHRRLWPALARLRDRLTGTQLAATTNEHTASGAHRSVSVSFADWMPDDVLAAAQGLSEADAVLLLPEPVRRMFQPPPAESGR
jgi:hypothetical protein